MSLDKLKDAARKFEQKEDWRRAIEVYLKAIQQIESGKDASPDLGLYNRVGDLYLKIGDTTSAVRHYERAVDLYADQGFFNNAIALCGKLLRVNPGRTQIYLKLAQLHARKNVVIEAKRNLLEFIERMHAQGQLDEAFAAVKGFADQFSGSQDIRLMLIELLRASSRADEAQAELDKLCLELEGRNGNAPRRSRERMDTPAAEAEGPAGPPKRSGDLVFLDTGPTRAPGAGKASGRKDERPALHDLIPEGLLVVEPPVEAETAPDVEPGVEPAPAASAGEADLAGAEPAPDLGAVEPEAAEAALQEPVRGPAEVPGPSVEPIEGLMAGGADDLLIVHDNPGGFGTTLLDEPPDLGPVDRIETVEGLVEAGRELGANDLQVERDEPLDLRGMRLDGLLGDDLAPAPADAELGDLDALAAPAPPLPEPESIELDLVDEPAPPAPPTVPAPPPARGASAASGAPAAGPPTIEELEQAVLDRPDDPVVHRALAEALLREGGVARAVEEFGLAASMYEVQEAWDDASAMMARVIDLEPGSIRHHQRRVEYAFRAGSRARLIEAYLALAEALVETRQPEKAVAVYRHVLDLDPGNRQAHQGLAHLAPPERPAAPRSPAPAAGAPAPVPGPREAATQEASRVGAAPAPEAPRQVEVPHRAEPPRKAEAPPRAEPPQAQAPAAPPAPPARRPAAARPPAADSDFVDLGSLVRDDEGPRDTRMRLEGARPSDDEQQNFEEMLAAFKRGIEQNLEDEDYQAHYDLGVAFKEMGLLDEAIAEFQKALRAPEVGARLRASEALGVAFFEKGQFGVAESVLRRAVEALDGADDAKVALLYWLGRAAEAQGKAAEALTCYERAMAVDIRFLDLGQRVGRLASGRRS